VTLSNCASKRAYCINARCIYVLFLAGLEVESMCYLDENCFGGCLSVYIIFYYRTIDMYTW